LILQKPLICSWKPSFSFSQDSYWVALWWNLFTSIGFPGNLKFNLELKNNIFCQHQHKKPFKVLFIFMSDFEKKYTCMLYLKYPYQNAKLFAFLEKNFSCIHFEKLKCIFVMQINLFWESSCSTGNLYSRKYFICFFSEVSTCIML